MKRVIFHIGRGGKFYNGGYLTCKGVDETDLEFYGENVFFFFENQNHLDFSPEDYDELTEIAGSLSNQDDDYTKEDAVLEILKKYDYTPEELGEPSVFTDNSEALCSLKEYNSNNCMLEIDTHYNTYYWLPIDELDEKEIQAMVRDLGTWEYKDALLETGVDEELFNFLEKTDSLKEKTWELMNMTFEEYINSEDIGVYDNENEADEAGRNIEFNGKFYII